MIQFLRHYSGNAAAMGGVSTPDGLTIANRASTTVTAVAPYWQVERTTGGGAWDASAVSAVGILGDILITFNDVTSAWIAGMSINPPSTDSWTDIVGFYSDGASVYAYSNGSQVGAAHTRKAWLFVRWTNADETVKWYSGDTAVFGSATLLETQVATGLSGTTWKFDSSLNTAGAKFLANMVNA